MPVSGEISITGIRGYFDISGKEWKDYIKVKDASGFVGEITKATNMSRSVGSDVPMTPRCLIQFAQSIE